MDLDALAFGAHPDDVELSCGGTLAALAALGHKAGLVTLTRGEMGTRGSAEIRAREFDAAAEILDLAAHRMLDIPDARVEGTWDNKLKIMEVLRAFRPRIVFAPYWVERHPDHEQTSHLVRQAAFLSGLKKIETGTPAFRPHKVIYYQSRFEFTPSFIVDITASHDRKMRAVRAYESQFFLPGRDEPGGGGTTIGRPEFLDRIEARDRHWGAKIGVKYGEAFFVQEAIQVRDPVAFFGPDYLWTMP